MVVFWVVLAVVVFSAVVAVVFLVVVGILGTLFVEAAATFLNMEKIESGNFEHKEGRLGYFLDAWVSMWDFLKNRLLVLVDLW